MAVVAGTGERYWLDELNEEQREAATHRGGPLLILAGAGTGKTTTLCARVAWLVSEGVPVNLVQAVMGHEQASTTLNRYTHVLAGTHARVRAALKRPPPVRRLPSSGRSATTADVGP